jgi:hypothetical protein
VAVHKLPVKSLNLLTFQMTKVPNLGGVKKSIKVRVPTTTILIPTAQVPDISNFRFFLIRHMSRSVFVPNRVLTQMPPSQRRLLSSSARSFSTSARCGQKPVMNRYSRRVTQPKDQGASQVNRVHSTHTLCLISK